MSRRSSFARFAGAVIFTLGVTAGAIADPACPADIDDDGASDFDDILLVLSTWGPCARCDADLDRNGEVDFGDFVAVIVGWGPCPVGTSTFTECAFEAGIDVTFAAPDDVKTDYGGGGAVGDFDRDGWMDLYILSGGRDGAPDHLFMNNGNGTFRDAAADWGMTVAHRGRGVAVGDINDDGWPDVYVTSTGPVDGPEGPGHHLLYRNDGGRTFTNIAPTAGVATANPTVPDGWGACFSDYDLDGDLDLMVAGFSLDNAGSRLFRNDRDETFTDITDAIGLFDGLAVIKMFVPALIDMNGDRWPDLLAVGDFGTGRYFRNDRDGTFTEMTAAAGVALEENGMGQTRADFDHDGRLDWYVTSIYLPQNGWTGNKLYRNLGAHVYEEFAETAGTADGGYGWGTVAVDFDHDGFVDIAETNGDAGNGGGVFENEPSYLWMNDGDGTFTESALDRGFEHVAPGRGMLHLDIENDGDQDVVIISYRAPLALFRNDLDLRAPGRAWLRVFLDTTGDPAKAPFGLGATVHVRTGAVTRMAPIDTADTYLGNNELSAHFGLGAAELVDEVRVEWTDGTTTILTEVVPNQTLTITPEP